MAFERDGPCRMHVVELSCRDASARLLPFCLSLFSTDYTPSHNISLLRNVDIVLAWAGHQRIQELELRRLGRKAACEHR